ncbi:MAG TPA: multidrug efflux RND transporter permease subunit [Phycisphaerae bacterium]|jgi:multidrug efflux pump|nr:multidrug efflux RND transporter permease subunit [Phycisphaerae bacterium]HOB75432.1 multidrug efflux RND transporter permease subunit [Phycisphaerae bacterium]HOJ55635.1 multidrug efflux RND transporter permease subunit [Phycisphaerae bacterium]HOL27646.1 multidrug efflux RND transporter permease subunit [Phycisphaerae bacterium]HPP21948.1 multidrug efflux RND transporter permease subunit [Phycisphaerae bacterium]
MKFAHFFIDHPVFASVISIVIVIVGALAAISLPISQYPEITPPTVIVSATYPGADARTVAETVATPIELQVNGVENMLYMSSVSSNDGSMRLTVTFAVGTNLSMAQVEVQNRVALAEPVLPEEVRRLGVVVRRASPDITIVVQLYSPDNRYDTLFLSNYATLRVRDQLARLPGVGDTIVFGAREYSMRVWLNPQELASRNLTAGDVVAAIREQNMTVAAGMVGAPPYAKSAAETQLPALQLSIDVRGRLVDPEEFGNIVVRTGPDGRMVHIHDVGRVELGAADYLTTTYLNGKPAVGIGIFQLPGTNAITTARAVREAMERLAKDFPPGLAYAAPYDTARFVRESLQDVVKTLLEATALVVIVVIVFLQGWRASIIPLLAVPVSLIGTCAVLWVMGFSLNTLSLFGMVLAIGIVVDDAIVVVENVERWIEQGLPPRQAAYRAMEEVTGAVIAIAMGLSAVFIPVAFISGITGQFYRQFALTIAFATLISALNSLTLSPAIAALILRPREPHHQDWLTRAISFVLGWFFHLFNRVFDLGARAYVAVLRRVVRLAVVMLIIYVGLLFLTYHGFRAVPTGFIPPQDTGYLLVNLQLPEAAALWRTDETIRKMAEIANADPGVRDTFAVAGTSFVTSTNQSSAGAMFIILKPFEERVGRPELSQVEIIKRIRRQYAQIQEGAGIILPPPPVRGMGNAGGFTLYIQDRTGTASPAELQVATQRVLAAAYQHPDKVQALLSTYRADTPRLRVEIDRAKVKQQNLQMADVFNTMQIFLGSLYVNDFNFLGRTFRVTAQAEAALRERPDEIGQLKVRNRDGKMVPLGSVLSVQQTAGPNRIVRYNLWPAADINGTAVPGVSTGQAIALMEKLATENLPRNFGFEWTGLAYQEKMAGHTAIYIFPLCVLFVWLTHSAEYESFALSTAIILIVPMCLLFGIGGVWLRGMDNNIFTQIGFVVLAGLSAKNAVLIVEFAKQQEEHGLKPFDAAIEAARLRLRPILMTSFAFILGVLPLVWATGAGSEMRQALGTAVFFGMLGVTNFGIFLTPVFYVTIRWITTKLRRRRPASDEGQPPPEAVPMHVTPGDNPDATSSNL